MTKAGCESEVPKSLLLINCSRVMSSELLTGALQPIPASAILLINDDGVVHLIHANVFKCNM